MQPLPEHPNYAAVGSEFYHHARDFAREELFDEEKRELFEQALDKLSSKELGMLAVRAAQFMDSEDAEGLLEKDAERRRAGRLIGELFGFIIDDSREAGAGYFQLISWPDYKELPKRAALVRERMVGPQTRTHLEYKGEHVVLIRERAANGYVSAWAVVYGAGQSAAVAARNILDSEVQTRYYDPKSFVKASGVAA